MHPFIRSALTRAGILAAPSDITNLLEGYKRSIASLAADSVRIPDSTLLDLSRQLFATGESHRAAIEQRATVCVGAASIAVTLALGTLARGSEATAEAQIRPILVCAALSFACYFVALVYLCTAAVQALAVHSDKYKRHVLGPGELVIDDDLPSFEYDRRIAVRTLNLTVANYEVYHQQAVTLGVAQRALRTALVFIVIGASIASAGRAIPPTISAGNPTPTSLMAPTGRPTYSPSLTPRRTATSTLSPGAVLSTATAPAARTAFP